VDAINYYRAEIEKLDARVQKFQSDVLSAEKVLSVAGGQLPPLESVVARPNLMEFISAGSKRDNSCLICDEDVTATGFVTFKTRDIQAMACKIPVLFSAYSKLHVQLAPEPKNIIWENLRFTSAYRNIASIGLSMLLFCGLLCWGSVVALIAAISNLSNLEPLLPFISTLDPMIYAIVQGLLPVGALAGISLLVPSIIHWMVFKFEKHGTLSAADSVVFEWSVYYSVLVHP
jgi:hypothetical protein